MSEEDRMVLENINLIHGVIKDFNLGYLADDLYDIGLIGLTKGIQSYNKELGNSESTYMYACIKREIFGYLRQKRAKKRSMFKEISLNVKIKTKNNDEEGVELIDCISDKSLEFEDNVENEEKIKTLEKYVDSLSDGQKEIICYYYGINGYNRMSVIDMKRRFGISKQAIFAKRNRALEKLKKMYEKDIERSSK
jgi:RNA polymerase sigma factor (sigma-70 family)